MADSNPLKSKFQPENFAPPPADAPPVLDLGKCQTMIRTAPAYFRHPGGDRLRDVVTQLDLLMKEYGQAAQKINAAQADAVRFQRDAQGANAELGKVSGELLQERQTTAALKSEVERLNAEVARLTRPAVVEPPPVAEKPKRGRKKSSNVVPMPTTERKAGA